MKWLEIGEVDVTAANGRIYLIDQDNDPYVNALDGKDSAPLDRDDPPPDAAGDTWNEKERERAADACARHAGVAPGEHEFTPW